METSKLEQIVNLHVDDVNHCHYCLQTYIIRRLAPKFPSQVQCLREGNSESSPAQKRVLVLFVQLA